MTVMKYDCHLIWLLFNTTIVQYECCAIWPPAFLLFTSMPPLMSWVFYKQCRPPVVITDQLQDVIYCRVPKRVCIYILRSVKQTFGTFGSVKGLYLCQKICKVGIFHQLTIKLLTKNIVGWYKMLPIVLLIIIKEMSFEWLYE